MVIILINKNIQFSMDLLNDRNLLFSWITKPLVYVQLFRCILPINMERTIYFHILIKRIKNVFQNTSLHGFSYILNKNVFHLDRCVWIGFIFIQFYFCYRYAILITIWSKIFTSSFIGFWFNVSLSHTNWYRKNKQLNDKSKCLYITRI